MTSSTKKNKIQNFPIVSVQTERLATSFKHFNWRSTYISANI